MAGELQKFNGNGNEKLPIGMRGLALPALVATAGEKGAYRFLEFFAANIQNPNTRAASSFKGPTQFALCRSYTLLNTAIIAFSTSARLRAKRFREALIISSLLASSPTRSIGG